MPPPTPPPHPPPPAALPTPQTLTSHLPPTNPLRPPSPCLPALRVCFFLAQSVLTFPSDQGCLFSSLMAVKASDWTELLIHFAELFMWTSEDVRKGTDFFLFSFCFFFLVHYFASTRRFRLFACLLTFLIQRLVNQQMEPCRQTGGLTDRKPHGLLLFQAFGGPGPAAGERG